MQITRIAITRIGMTIMTVGLVGLSAEACSSTTTGTAPTSGPCPKRSGNYALSFEEKSGNCGTLDVGAFNLGDCLQVICVPYSNIAPAGQTSQLQDLPGFDACSGTVTVSADNCTAEFSYGCTPKTTAGGSVLLVGKVTWAGNAASGQSDNTNFSKNGTVECKSTYAVTVSKQ